MNGMYDKLLKAGKAKDLFFARMSHELRNALNSLIGSINLMIGLKTMEEISEMLQTAKICSEHLLNLIGNILDINRAETGRIEIISSTCDIRTTANKVIKMCRATQKKPVDS